MAGETFFENQLMLGIAHELRGNLMTIQLVADELGGGQPVDRVEMAQDVNESVQRATALVDELWALAEPTGALAARLDVVAVVQRMQRLLRRFSGLGRRLEVRFDVEHAWVAACIVPLKLALMALVFVLTEDLAPAGQLGLLVSARELSDRSGRMVVIGTRDLGGAPVERLSECGEGVAGPACEQLRALMGYADVLGARVLVHPGPSRLTEVWLVLPELSDSRVGEALDPGRG